MEMLRADVRKLEQRLAELEQAMRAVEVRSPAPCMLTPLQPPIVFESPYPTRPPSIGDPTPPNITICQTHKGPKL